uniref:M48 family metallopeptidase n=1 Tax=Ferrimicrobium sp. TaxID=2926050 RepID=UPI00262EDEF8
MPARRSNITIDGVEVEVTLKVIKHVHIRVSPPHGTVRVSAPCGTSLDEIHTIVLSRLGWIRRHQVRFAQSAAFTAPRMETGELHYCWGKPYPLLVREGPTVRVELWNGELVLEVPSGSSKEERERLLERWYRQELKGAIPSVLARWERIVGVHPSQWGVRKMRTLWGSCNTKTARIWFNLELAKKHPESLDYVAVHELTHLLEPSHGARFEKLVARAMPDWEGCHQRISQSIF